MPYSLTIDEDKMIHLDASNWKPSLYRRFLLEVKALRKSSAGLKITASVNHQNKTVRRLLKKHGFTYHGSVWSEPQLVLDVWSINP